MSAHLSACLRCPSNQASVCFMEVTVLIEGKVDKGSTHVHNCEKQ